MKEFKHGETVQVKIGMIWHSRVYIGAYQEHHIVGDTLGGIEEHSDTLIRKESPSFKDVEIDWRDGEAWIDNESIAFDGDLSQLCIGGTTSNGWALSGYLIDGYDEVYRTPMLFNTNGTEVKLKATHARFVKIN